MISKFMMVAFVAAALGGCATDAPPPTREDRVAECEASCVAMDGTFERLDHQGCVCLKTEKLDSEWSGFDSQCTPSGCARVCGGAGLCVNASANNSGGCNYYCIAPSIEPEPEPEPPPPTRG